MKMARVAGCTLRLIVTPDERARDLSGLLGFPDLQASPQGGGDLGDRLLRAVERAFAGGAAGVILLGGDSPTLPASIVEDAAALLTQHDAVLGPCDDGGYYLLGLRRALPALFHDVGWGGEQVAEQTRARARVAGIDLAELPGWYDLDRVEDLARAAVDLAPAVDDTTAARELYQLIRECA